MKHIQFAILAATLLPAAVGTDAAPSLVSLSAGAFMIVKPEEYRGAYSSPELLDERPNTNWSAPRGVLTPQRMVIALPEKTILKTLIFDCAQGVSYAGSCAKDISIEMSDTSERDGFKSIGEVSLKEGADGQTFPVAAGIAGRWVRLTVENNHGSQDLIQPERFRATGTPRTHQTGPAASGTSTYVLCDYHLPTQGPSVA